MSLWNILLICQYILTAECVSWTQGQNAILSVDLTNINSYTISINNETWLSGGEPNLWCNHHWYSPSNINGYALIPTTSSPIQINGNEPNLGNWIGLQMTYTLVSNDNICGGKHFITTFQYFKDDDFFLFTQSYPDGLPNTNITQVIDAGSNLHPPIVPFSEFPAFSFDDFSMLRSELGYIEWAGLFMHDRSSHGIGLSSFEGGVEGGPIVLFKDGTKPPLAPSLVFSSASSFMHGIFSIRTRRGYSNDGHCSLYDNIDFEGNDFMQINNVSNVEDCCSLCTINEYCNVFSYIANNQQCFLKYTDRGKTSTPGHVSGSIGENSNNGVLDYLVSGIQGNLTMIPKEYSISFIISATNNSGIHGAAYKWGQILQKKYQTTRLDSKNDLVSTTLGYWTDNGGYFWDSNPLTTDIATKLFQTFKQNDVPVRYLQLDPYWFMGTAPVYNDLLWLPDTTLFPNGLTDLYNKTNETPLLLYSFFWNANKTVNYFNSKYSLNLTFQNTNKYKPPWTNHEPIAQPLGYQSSYTFYKFIVSQYSDIMAGFEIDFMNYNYESFPFEMDGYNGYINESEQWTKGMQDALYEFRFPIQYCMSLPSYILQALQYPAVTNARASTDNFPNNHNRWQIGYTSLLLSPLNILPYFDTLWTTSNQPGNTYNANEMDVEMEVIIATLSNGPIGIGDNINMTNKTIINRFVRKDGILLHPSISATPIDAMYSSISTFKPSGEIWITHSSINDNVEGYHILTIDVINEYKLSFHDLYPYPSSNDDVFMIYKFDDSNNDLNGQCKNNTNIQQCDIEEFSFKQELSIKNQPTPKNNSEHLHSWNLYNIVFKQRNGWTLLGEMNKYINLSPQRFSSIQVTNNGMKVIVSGSPNEHTIISFITNTSSILQIGVMFNNNGDNQTIVVQ